MAASTLKCRLVKRNSHYKDKTLFDHRIFYGTTIHGKKIFILKHDPRGVLSHIYSLNWWFIAVANFRRSSMYCLILDKSWLCYSSVPKVNKGTYTAMVIVRMLQSDVNVCLVLWLTHKYIYVRYRSGLFKISTFLQTLRWHTLLENNMQVPFRVPSVIKLLVTLSIGPPSTVSLKRAVEYVIRLCRVLLCRGIEEILRITLIFCVSSLLS